MLTLDLDSELVCNILQRNSSTQFSYSRGCFTGRFQLPIGSVLADIIPDCREQTLVLSIPFSSIRAGFGGQFLLSKLVKTFWGSLSKKIENACHPWLRNQGLPLDTVQIHKSRFEAQEIGQILISIEAVNRALEARHPSLRPKLCAVEFSDSGIRIMGDLSGSKS